MVLVSVPPHEADNPKRQKLNYFISAKIVCGKMKFTVFTFIRIKTAWTFQGLPDNDAHLIFYQFI